MLLFQYCKCPTVGQLIYFPCYSKTSNAVILILQVSHRGTLNLFFLLFQNIKCCYSNTASVPPWDTCRKSLTYYS